jgi:hypothetical protein
LKSFERLFNIRSSFYNLDNDSGKKTMTADEAAILGCCSDGVSRQLYTVFEIKSSRGMINSKHAKTVGMFTN